MNSSEDNAHIGNDYVSPTCTASYNTVYLHEDHDYLMSDASSVISEPPLEMDLDCDLDPGMDLDLALEVHRRMSSSPSPYEERSPSPYEESPAVSPKRRTSSKLQDVDQNSLSDSGSHSSGRSGESDNEDDLSEEGHISMSASRVNKSLTDAPLEKFYTLKIDSVVSNFEKAPCEVLMNIATRLPSDSDVMSLILTCHTFARQIQPENSGVWKTRFLQKYDHPIIKGPFDFRIAYQLRALALPRFGDLGFETKDNARILLNVLKDMVLETYNKAHPSHDSPRTSLNIASFSDAMKSTWMVHFLSTPLFARDQKHLFGRPYKLFDTLQIVFSYLVLNRGPMAFQIGSDKKDYDLEKVYNWDQPFASLYIRMPDKEERTPPLSLFPNLRKETPPPKKFKVDINTLLHIRNFWHRHLTESKAMGGEETFADMAADLARVGISPKAWTHPLQGPSKLEMKWYGHYSTVYPCPKSRTKLEEKESEAELWETVDPLCLEFGSNNQSDAAWPQIFASIPVFASTITSVDACAEKGAIFIRGLAPFQAPNHIKAPTAQHTLSVQHHHPYTRMRLRGLIHPIQDQQGIPGWKRAVFVLYKPTFRSLCEIFDHATEWFGEPFQQQLNNILGATIASMTHAEVEQHYEAHLTMLLHELKGPVEMNRELIEKMEDAYSDPRALRWEDMEYSYAYEGVVTPGGKVMLGRWWRVGRPGARSVGDGQEWFNPEMPYERERGPFVFWSKE